MAFSNFKFGIIFEEQFKKTRFENKIALKKNQNVMQINAKI